jgi:hypothetical protein
VKIGSDHVIVGDIKLPLGSVFEIVDRRLHVALVHQLVVDNAFWLVDISGESVTGFDPFLNKSFFVVKSSTFVVKCNIFNSESITHIINCHSTTHIFRQKSLHLHDINLS